MIKPFKIIRKLWPTALGIFKNKDKFKSLINQSIDMTEGNDAFERIEHNLKLALNMSLDYIKGNYRDVRKKNLIIIIAGLIYLINPMDFVPDFLVGIGILDDISVLTYVLSKISKELKKYESFKNEEAEI